MRIEDLRLFLFAARHGSLSAAGRELGLSPAAASARLTALEKALGATLMARSTRSLSLTEDGEIFLDHARLALDTLDAAEAALSNSSAVPHGRLRAAIPGPFGRKHILPFLKEFRQLYPALDLDLNLSDEFVNLVEDGYDLGIRIGVPRDSALRMTHLAPNRRIVVASPAFIAQHGAPERPEDCAKFEAVYQTNIRNWPFRRGEERVHVRVSGPISSNSGAVLQDGALLGLGIALKSIWDVGTEIEAGRLVHLLPEWELENQGTIYAVRPAGSYTPPKVRAFIDFLKSKYQPVPYWEPS